jgi:carboxypeptidase C (cathepsin A)
MDVRRAIRIPRLLLLLALTLAVPATAMAQGRPGRPGGGPPGQQGQGQQGQGQQRQQGQPAQQGPQRDQGPGVLRLLPNDSVTEHSIDLPAGKLAYTATAGTLSLYDQSGERIAAVFYTAYVAKSADGTPRPLTFAFNGGPGAASAYLHLGLVGPKILQFSPDDHDGATAQLRDNPQTWLEFTDLVLIDPVGTGWSRPAKPDGGKDFWGVSQDANFFAKVIALYVANNSRSAAPKYLLGESYGGFRAAKVARALQRDQGIFVSGIVMVSPMLEGALQFGGDNFALGAALHLPTLAAAELERKHAFSKEALAEAERFAMTDYLTTLAGPAPQGEAARGFYARVAQMTGIPEDAVTKARGFLRGVDQKDLPSAEGKIVSGYDATIAVDDPFPEQRSQRGPDPVLDGFTRAYGGAFVGYARDELGFKTEMTYSLLAGDVGGKWVWREGNGPSMPSAGDDLRILLTFNSSFRLFIAHGYADLVTPYMASRYVIEHFPGTDPAGRAQLRLYSGGHMFYVADESRKNFSADAKAFFTKAAAP